MTLFNWLKAISKFLHQNIYDERSEYFNQYIAYDKVNKSLEKKLIELEDKYDRLKEK